MRIKRNRKGFTMAELLIVVAIIGILGGVGFVAVQNQQRSTTRLEHDNIAKEIFIAAQNHLTMAESQGFLGDAEGNTLAYGTADGSAYYIAYKEGSAFNAGSMLNLMLPFGSIDESVRTGGSYVIRYQKKPALVLDVFYWDKAWDSAWGEKGALKETIYAELKGLEGSTDDRQNHTPIIGWYGGVDAQASGGVLQMPTIEVANAERLTVTVTDPNYASGGNTSIKLFVTGCESQARASILLNTPSARVPASTTGIYTVILDDITQPNTHFKDLNQSDSTETSPFNVEGRLIPGEDIVVEAVAYSTNTLTSISYSNQVTTNSLFAELEAELPDAEASPEKLGSVKVKVQNFRHLANLNGSLSGFKTPVEVEGKEVEFFNDKYETDAVSVEQIADLVWKDDDDPDHGFVNIIGGTADVYVYLESFNTKRCCFLPVSANYPMIYEGNHHLISNVVVDNEGTGAIVAGGVFGTLTDSTIQNLKLVDTSVNVVVNARAAVSAGALAGGLTGCTVENVVAYNSALTENGVACYGSAGGLVGEMVGGSVSKCAAALIVKSSAGNAGGLVGTITSGTGTGDNLNGTITACYSGGHTTDGMYSSTDYNVTAASAAGGLIGDAGKASISNSYSTCSAKGMTAGGFVGASTAASGAISNCYATGLVSGTTAKGAFAGSLTNDAGSATYTALNNCKYYMIINESKKTTGGGYAYLDPIGGQTIAESDLTIIAMDESATRFTGFASQEKDNGVKKLNAVVYDSALTALYSDGNGATGQSSYSLKTIRQLDSSVAATDFVATHYGDWPAPETFVFNVINT